MDLHQGITSCPYREGWYYFVTHKTIKIFLSQNKLIETWQRQTPRIFHSFIIILRVKMRRTSTPMVFNLFHAATHFATLFNLTTPFRKFPLRHIIIFYWGSWFISQTQEHKKWLAIHQRTLQKRSLRMTNIGRSKALHPHYSCIVIRKSTEDG